MNGGRAINDARMGQCLPQPLGQLHSRLLSRHGQHNQKLFAADAPQQVPRAQNRLCRSHHFAQRAVTGGVAVGVVDGFEAVQVKHDQGRIRAVTQPVGHQSLQVVEHMTAAVGTRELVVRQQVAQTFDQGHVAGLLVDVAKHHQPDVPAIAQLNHQCRQKTHDIKGRHRVIVQGHMQQRQHVDAAEIQQRGAGIG